ncbi:MAG: hypothetical protein V3S24_04675, partial [Candidatus Tectomicrobia bacterium]
MRQAITVDHRIGDASQIASGKSLQALAWRQLLRKRTAMVGLVIIAGLVLTALLATLIAPYSPT